MVGPSATGWCAVLASVWQSIRMVCLVVQVEMQVLRRSEVLCCVQFKEPGRFLACMWTHVSFGLSASMGAFVVFDEAWSMLPFV